MFHVNTNRAATAAFARCYDSGASGPGSVWTSESLLRSPHMKSLAQTTVKKTKTLDPVEDRSHRLEADELWRGKKHDPQLESEEAYEESVCQCIVGKPGVTARCEYLVMNRSQMSSGTTCGHAGHVRDKKQCSCLHDNACLHCR